MNLGDCLTRNLVIYRDHMVFPGQWELGECEVWNVTAHAQKPEFFFRRNERVHLNWRGRQFRRLLAAEMCASAVVMLDTPRSEVVWRVLATHCILKFPLHFPSRASPCTITFQLDSISHMYAVPYPRQAIAGPSLLTPRSLHCLVR